MALITVRLIQLAGDAIIYALNSIFKSIIQTGVYPDAWKLTNLTNTSSTPIQLHL